MTLVKINSVILFKFTINFGYLFDLYVYVARLDGTNKPMKHTTFEDYLQMDGWEPPPFSNNGKKRVKSLFHSLI